jgi:hypothetical protein
VGARVEPLGCDQALDGVGVQQKRDQPPVRLVQPDQHAVAVQIGADAVRGQASVHRRPVRPGRGVLLGREPVSAWRGFQDPRRRVRDRDVLRRVVGSVEVDGALVGQVERTAVDDGVVDVVAPLAVVGQEPRKTIAPSRRAGACSTSR